MFNRLFIKFYADNIQLNLPTTSGQVVATKEAGGVQHELVIVEYADGSGNPVEVAAATPLPVTIPNVGATSNGLNVYLLQNSTIVPVSIQNTIPITSATLATSANQTNASQKTQVVDGSGNVIASNNNALDVYLVQNSTVVPVSIQSVGGGATLATSANQTNASQKTQIVDGSANVISSTSNALNVNIQNSSLNIYGTVNTKDLPDPSSTYALSNATSTAYEASRVIKSSPGILYMITGYNSRTSTQFIMISNTTSVPGDGQTPVIVFVVPASSNFAFDLGKYGRYFSTGICIFNSSTSPTKTLGSADCFFDCQYI